MTLLARNTSASETSILGPKIEVLKRGSEKKGLVIMMIKADQLKVDGKDVLGLKVDLPDSPPLVIIIGRKVLLCADF